jgi:hypothetical protein
MSVYSDSVANEPVIGERVYFFTHVDWHLTPVFGTVISQSEDKKYTKIKLDKPTKIPLRETVSFLFFFKRNVLVEEVREVIDFETERMFFLRDFRHMVRFWSSQRAPNS